ncbi:phage/plasmid primase, P4 family [Coleofasciculus sp. FACHB-SPT9]|uniref:phage/plasmid primase, P4 family n=1 Tax=Cyanophyceae TaxID=3028117 RepID=UPI001682D454|nr:DUF3854 domain-containing protein [Coleofasciculus sp. FACHB-SPT9]
MQELTAVQPVEENNQAIAIDQQPALAISAPQPPKLKQFDIREWANRLTPVEGRKNEYLCPECDKTLTIDLNEGAYLCWANVSRQSIRIREEIAPSLPKPKKVITAPPKKPKPAVSEKVKEVVALPLIETRPEHIKEWVEGSGISEELTNRNLRSIDDEKEIARLLNWKAYTGSPGWYVRSVDPSTGMYTNSGQFKPDIPIDFKQDGNSQKYITFPKGGKLRPIFPVVDMATWEAIAKKHGLEFQGSIDKSRNDNGFWKWVLDNPKVPIVITEGGKKGHTILTNGCVPIILPGVWGGQRDKKYLTEDLNIFVVPGRGVFLGFDSDLRENKKVKAALDNLAKLITQKGCVPKVLDWEPEQGKGIDDFIVSQGVEALDELIAKALPYDEWRLKLEAQFESKKSSSKGKSEKREKLPLPDILGEKIAEDYRDKLAYNDVTGIWMRYEGDHPGVWSPETNEFVESMISSILKARGISGYGSHSFVVNIVKKLRCELLQRRWEQPSANKLLPFHDGVLELATGKLLPHSPGYKFTWALERSHDSNATDWSLIDQFLTHATGGNDRLKEILICYCHAVLMGRADLQKFLHLTGVGGSGKGTYMRLLVDLIGQTNVHSSTLEDWCGNRFEAANAFGKRLVVFWDEDKALKQLGRFKSLIGQDLLRGEEKGKKAFQFRFDGMVAVSSNFPIFAGDNSSGMSRRVIGIPFNATIAASKRRDLSKDFQPQLAAFTNYLLTIPSQRVTEVLLGLEAAPELNQQFWESRIRTDSVAAWLNDRVIRDSLATTPVGNDAEDERMLYGSYVQHCRKSGTPARGNKNFSPDLLELCRTILGWTEIEKVHTKTGKLIKGLRLRDDSRDGNIPTYDYELLQEVKGQVKGSEGYGDGSEPLPSKAVTDSDGLNKISKSGLKEDEIQSTVNVQRATENTDESTYIKDVEPDPSPSVTPLPSKAPDPSLDPSPDPSLAPSSAMGEEEIGHDCSPEEIANIAQMILEATDGISIMQVMSLFVNSIEKAKKEVWKRLTPEERERIETSKAQAQRDAQPGVKCWVKCPEDYVWRKATLISVPKLPGTTYWRFELEDDLKGVKKEQLIHTRRDSVESSWWLIA